MQFDFSSFILGKTSDVVFLWKYISIIYVYLFFFASLSKYSKPSWSGKRTLVKGLASSLSCRVDQVCSCCSWVLVEGKKMLLKNIT